MTKPRSKMNRTQKTAYKQLCDVFGDQPFYAHVPSKELTGGCWYGFGREPRWVQCDPYPGTPREYAKKRYHRGKLVQMRKGTWTSLVKRGVVFPLGDRWCLTDLRVSSRIQLLLEVA